MSATLNNWPFGARPAVSSERQKDVSLPMGWLPGDATVLPGTVEPHNPPAPASGLTRMKDKHGEAECQMTMLKGKAEPEAGTLQWAWCPPPPQGARKS